MALRPLHDRVIVKRLDNERTTASGIVIPDSAAEKPDQGEVLAVGPGKKTEDGKVIAVDVKVGAKVIVLPKTAAPTREASRPSAAQVASYAPAEQNAAARAWNGIRPN